MADDEVCELVNGFDVELGNEEDGFSGYYTQALKNNNGAGVLLLSDVYGYESSGIRDFVYRLACFGYKYGLSPFFCSALDHLSDTFNTLGQSLVVV